MEAGHQPPDLKCSPITPIPLSPSIPHSHSRQNSNHLGLSHRIAIHIVVASTEIHSFVANLDCERWELTKWGCSPPSPEIETITTREFIPNSSRVFNLGFFHNTGTMRLSQTPPVLISLLVLLSRTTSVEAVPTPKEVLEKLGYGVMEVRDVGCGVSSQYTCTGAQACYTNAAQVAYCSVPGGNSGGYVVYTTTYTETDLELRTSTSTSWFQVATTNAAPTPTGVSAPICDTSLEETSCGPICCAGNQVCAAAGSCAPRPSSTAAVLTSYTYIVSTMATTTSTFSAPLRPTSGTITTFTSATTTQTFISPATASGSTIPNVSTLTTSHGLSGGAIAGIVIGTIAGIILLLLICFCCIVKAGFDGLLALFGLGSRRNRRSRERVEVVEERYSRHGSGTASRRDTHTGWFGAGGRPARVTETRKKKSSGFGGLGAVGAGLVGLAVILGLKRNHDKKEMVERTDISSSYYTDSYTGTSASKHPLNIPASRSFTDE